MIGIICKTCLAVIASIISFKIWWWSPIVIYPAAFFIVPNFGVGEDYSLSKMALETRRWFFYIVSLGFVGLMTYSFQINIGSWYGWLLGLVFSWLACGSVAADLKEYLRF